VAVIVGTSNGSGTFDYVFTSAPADGEYWEFLIAFDDVVSCTTLPTPLLPITSSSPPMWIVMTSTAFSRTLCAPLLFVSLNQASAGSEAGSSSKK
jgi:hypothetical protein